MTKKYVFAVFLCILIIIGFLSLPRLAKADHVDPPVGLNDSLAISGSFNYCTDLDVLEDMMAFGETFKVGDVVPEDLTNAIGIHCRNDVLFGVVFTEYLSSWNGRTRSGNMIIWEVFRAVTIQGEVVFIMFPEGIIHR